MIGINTRGLGHFKRNVPFNTPLCFFLGRFENSMEGEVLKVETPNGVYLMLFNNKRNYNEFYLDDIKRSLKNSEIQKVISNFRSKYGGVLIFHTFDKSEQMMWQNYTPALLMPKNFEEDYNAFCDANKKLFSSLFAFNSPQSPIAKVFYALSGGSPNMFLWALTNIYKSVPSYLIVDMLYWFNNYNQFSGKLKKGSITSYNGVQNILKLQEELIALRQEKRIASVFNMFNTQQKKLLKSATLNKQETEMVSRFETMSKEKQINFIRKVSTLETKEEIFHQMALLTKVHFDWNRESFLEFITNIENLSFDIVFDNNNIVILSVKDYDTIKYVTRTTNWCISKNKRYWDDYTSKDNRVKRNQYVLFDFNQKEDSEYSIVGFTTKDDKDIVHAHSFTNANLMNNSYEFNVLTSFRMRQGGSIVGVLNNLSIPLDKFMRCPSLPYKWEKESIMDILSRIDENKYTIIKDEDGLLAFTIQSPNDIFNLVGVEQYTKAIQNIDYNPIERKHLFIFNFNKNTDDKMLWTFITSDYDGIERTDCGVYNVNGNRYNKSLNYCLYQNGLPFNVFSRPIDDFLLVRDAFYTNDVDMLSILLEKDSVRQMLNEKKYILKDEIYESLTSSIFRYYSFDVLHLLYKNSYKLANLIGFDAIDSILRNAMEIMLSRCNKAMKNVPTESDFEDLMRGQFNENKALAYGMFFIIEKIFDNESNQNILKKWYKKIHVCPNFLQKHFIAKFVPFINQIVSREKIDYITSLIMNCDYYEIFENNTFNSEFVQTLYNKLSDGHPWKQKIVSKEKVTVNS